VRVRDFRLTWAWTSVILAVVLLTAAAVTIAGIALRGADRSEVKLAILLIGFPALVAVASTAALGVIVSRPAGSKAKSIRRWLVALVGAVTLLCALATMSQSASGVLLVVAGLCVFVYLALDIRRERRGG